MLPTDSVPRTQSLCSRCYKWPTMPKKALYLYFIYIFKTASLISGDIPAVGRLTAVTLRRRRRRGLTSEGGEQRAVLPVITFVALTEVEQQEHIHQHPHQRGGQHHLAVDKPSHHPPRKSVELGLGSARSADGAMEAWRPSAESGGRHHPREKRNRVKMMISAFSQLIKMELD